MRWLLALAAVVSLDGFASGPFTNLDFGDVCKGDRVFDSGYTLVCFGAENAAAVRGARVGENTRVPPKVGQKFVGAIELGVLPDADTDLSYAFTRKLLDKQDRTVGYLQIEGWRNDEMGVKYQLTMRYNAKGALVSAKVK